MRKRTAFVLIIILFLLLATVSSAMEREKALLFVGQDLHLRGAELISYQLSTAEYALVFQNGFSMSIGANQFSSDMAVVWLRSVTTEFRGRILVDYKAKVYIEGAVSVEQGEGKHAVDLSQRVVEEGRSMVVRFDVSGEVFVTAEKREIADPRGLELYGRALAAVVPAEREFVVQPRALVPELPAEEVRPVKEPEEVVTVKPSKPEVVERVEVKEPRFVYPVTIAPAGKVKPKVESSEAPDGTRIETVIGRFYLWQKQDEKGGLLELQADSAVIFRSRGGLEAGEDVLAGGAVRAVYVSGDVVMTEGQRTIRADEMYYDFWRKKAVAINAVMRNFDAARGIPIYVRAAKLRQIAENKFTAENITLTSSEFYQPQISFNASQVIITDTTGVDEREDKISDSSYDAEMHDVRMKINDKTVFYWPFVRSNLQRPDVPLKSVHVGHDRTWGTTIETRWYLSRLLGLREPEGTDGTFAFDYYDKRGVGSGVEIDYQREDYFGGLLGYVIKDSGKDRLGRAGDRKDIEPPRELRGRFLWRHRQFLPYNWQLTAEVSYASDEHFIEGYYRSEFYVGKEQETLIHLKRIEDNWGLSILGKARINDFVSKLEEIPTVEFHLTGQSFLDDKLTFYSDNQISRFRQRLSPTSSSTTSGKFFPFMSTRNEVDMPMMVGGAKVVPFVAGTLGYEDDEGFRTDIDGKAAGREDKVWMGEAGVRVSSRYWKVYPDVKSRLWDLNQLRHIVKPHVTAVLYSASDSVIDQRDTLNVGISQRLQTKRGVAGSGGEQRTIDWMRLDMDVTWVKDSGDASAGADRFIWNKPFIPLVNTFSTAVPPQDRRSSNIFGPRRNYIGADYMWRLSDTSAVLSDLNFDIQSGVVQQFNIGFSHLRWPNLSYYIGSRYLRRTEIAGETGSNAFTFAATYILDPRYTLVFSQQFDFDYGANIRSDITLIRRYHRVYWAITYSADESLDESAIVFSIWPQGVPELAIGSRRYVGLSGSAVYW